MSKLRLAATLVLATNYRQRLSYVAIRQEKSKLSKNKRV
jgi:hypothetical protein